MAAAATHREAIVRTAATLFRRQGYAATGTNQIVARSGAPKGSLYHYFPAGKAAIAEATVRHAGAVVQNTLDDLARTEPDASSMLRAYGTLLAGWMAKSGYRDGCPITMTLLELAPSDAAVAQAGEEMIAGWSGVFAAKLEAQGALPVRAARLAHMAIAALTGALIQARAAQSAAPILDTCEEVAALFSAGTQLL